MSENDGYAETCIRSLVHKYLDVCPEVEDYIVNYAVQTWLPMPKMPVMYLRFMGAIGTGHTRAGKVMEAVCRNALLATGFTSVAEFTRMMDQNSPCVPIIDVSQFDEEVKEIARILSIGNERGNKIIRMVEAEKGKFQPESFDVYGYKVILAYRPFRDLAVETRCMTIQLSGLTRKDVPLFLDDEFENDRARIQENLKQYFNLSQGVNHE